MTRLRSSRTFAQQALFPPQKNSLDIYEKNGRCKIRVLYLTSIERAFYTRRQSAHRPHTMLLYWSLSHYFTCVCSVHGEPPRLAVRDSYISSHTRLATLNTLGKLEEKHRRDDQLAAPTTALGSRKSSAFAPGLLEPAAIGPPRIGQGRRSPTRTRFSDAPSFRTYTNVSRQQRKPDNTGLGPRNFFATWLISLYC